MSQDLNRVNILIDQEKDEYQTLLIDELPKDNLKVITFNRGTIAYRLVSYYEKLINDFATKLYDKRVITKPFRCRIFNIDTKELNANCIKSKSYNSLYYIGFNVGLFESIMNDFASFSRTVSFDRYLDKYKKTNPVISFDVMGMKAKGVNPTEAIRINIMILFTLMHEVGHILCGHCEPSKEECETGKFHFSDNYLYQAQEYAADYFATIFSFAYLRFVEEAMDITELSTYYMVSAIEYWSSFLSNEPSFSFYYGKSFDHPHSIVRMRYMFKWIKSEMFIYGISKESGKPLFLRYKTEVSMIHSGNRKKRAELLLNEDEKKKVRVRLIDDCIIGELLEIVAIENKLDAIFRLYEDLSLFHCHSFRSMKAKMPDFVHCCFSS